MLGRNTILACLSLWLALAAPAAHAAGGSSGGSGGASRSPSYVESYVAIDTMQVTLIQAAQVRGLLIVSIGLDIPDAHLREEAEHMMPRLRDAYINRLSRHGATRIDPRRITDVEMIADLLQATTDQVLETEGAQVLLLNVLVRAGLNRQGAITSRR